MNFKAKKLLQSDSNEDSFTEIDPENGTFRYWPGRVTWALLVSDPDLNKVPLVNSLIARENLFDEDEALAFWRKLALHDVLAYLIHSVDKAFDIDYQVGEKNSWRSERSAKFIFRIADLRNGISVYQSGDTVRG